MFHPEMCTDRLYERRKPLVGLCYYVRQVFQSLAYM